MKKSILFGAGKIARGFLGQLLYLSDFEITFVDVYEPIVSVLNEKKTYHVHVLGDESLDSDVTHIKAYLFDEKESIYHTFYESDIAFVSVGGNHLTDVAKSLADIFNRFGIQKKIKNIIVCENWRDAANTFKTAMLKFLNEENKNLFEEFIGVSEAVLMRTATQPDEELAKLYPQDVWVQNFWYLPIDGSRIKEAIPKIQCVELLDEFGNFLTQKMYTNNTSNAVIAYSGYLLGYEILAEAANSLEISALLDDAYKEINQILVAELGVDEKQQMEFSQKARAKYCDWTIVDKVIRHGKDPIRKLGPQDRLIAPCRMALKHGIYPKTLIDTIAKALYFDEPSDVEAVKLKMLRQQKGIEYVLQTVCGLDKTERLYHEILKSVEQIKEQGLVKGHE
ncbi:mannitol dehydrogenase family protein [Amedibacillus dolichus]|uniref:Mannitol dehydrogenase domain protein n=1 Tax=Amedibacillus dolichus DSM 3991 TaxID=428127 RepID=A8RA68_9FIRM|nr:mannitol-1-phosphate 5-dehydrogenase [Amedibacillus dolichus]EDP11544.1 mannitol dehydrogenase domain protein [Amedibacillus dolichus DSM 3991]